jgi:predicted TIM-barrel fold metal-dependent hydrolase
MHVGIRGVSADRIVDYMDRNGIDACWLLTWEEIHPVIPREYSHLPIDDVFEAYQRFPGRILPMYAPDPCAPDAPERLRHWHRQGIRGCGELKVRLSWTSGKLDGLLRCVRDLGLPLVFHMENRREAYMPDSGSAVDRLLGWLLSSSRLKGVPRAVAERLARICPPLGARRERLRRLVPGYLVDFDSLKLRLEAYPDVNFVGHGPLFWAGISEDTQLGSLFPEGEVGGEGTTCRLLAEHDNLYADLSGVSGFNAITRDVAFTKRFLPQYEEKILFGTDNCSLGQREFLDSLGLSKRTYHRIYYGNANGLAAP